MNEKLDYSTGLLLAFFTLMILLVILLLIPSIGHAQAGDPYPAPIITVVPYPAPIITAIPYPTGLCRVGADHTKLWRYKNSKIKITPVVSWALQLTDIQA